MLELLPTELALFTLERAILDKHELTDDYVVVHRAAGVCWMWRRLAHTPVLHSVIIVSLPSMMDDGALLRCVQLSCGLLRGIELHGQQRVTSDGLYRVLSSRHAHAIESVSHVGVSLQNDAAQCVFRAGCNSSSHDFRVPEAQPGSTGWLNRDTVLVSGGGRLMEARADRSLAASLPSSLAHLCLEGLSWASNGKSGLERKRNSCSTCCRSEASFGSRWSQCAGCGGGWQCDECQPVCECHLCHRVLCLECRAMQQPGASADDFRGNVRHPFDTFDRDEDEGPDVCEACEPLVWARCCACHRVLEEGAPGCSVCHQKWCIDCWCDCARECEQCGGDGNPCGCEHRHCDLCDEVWCETCTPEQAAACDSCGERTRCRTCAPRHACSGVCGRAFCEDCKQMTACDRCGERFCERCDECACTVPEGYRRRRRNSMWRGSGPPLSYTI